MKQKSRAIEYLFVAGLMCWASLTWAQDRSPKDQQSISALLSEMKTADLPSMQPIAVEPFKLPTASVDVMRVRLEETYDVKGVGKDTVPLYGWIAVTHDNPRAAKGETEVRWGTASSQTQFVGMELNGESKIFGPVHVQLAPGIRSTGEVGKLELSLVDRILTNIAYMPYRPSEPGDVVATITPLPLPELPQLVHVAFVGEGGKGGEAAVKQTLLGVLSAISDKNASALLKFYSKSSEDTFFNGALSSPAKGGDEYVAELGKMFASLQTIRAIPDDKSIHIKVSGDLASASLTGHNDVVDNDGNRGSSAWAWSVQLEKQKTGWVITHDQLAFAGAGAAAGDTGKIKGAAACLANASVSINMPKLNLHMQTERPVTWYSEVQTIPPVGSTASVSFTPTPLDMDGRQVATLTSGVVKFREVVRKVKLEGTQPGDKMMATR